MAFFLPELANRVASNFGNRSLPRRFIGAAHGASSSHKSSHTSSHSAADAATGGGSSTASSLKQSPDTVHYASIFDLPARYRMTPISKAEEDAIRVHTADACFIGVFFKNCSFLY